MTVQSPRKPVVDLAVFGKFNAFHLARELDSMGWLGQFHVAYPRKVHGVDPSRVSRVPFLYEAFYLIQRCGRVSPYPWFAERFDHLVAGRLARGNSRVFHGWAGYCCQSLRYAKEHGMVAVVDRAGTHVLWQRRLMEEEAARTGISFDAGYFGMTDRMLEEYETADWIAVPSTYAKETFIQHGVPADKIFVMTAGVKPPESVMDPKDRSEVFTALFVGGVGAQKGLYYVLEGWRRAGLRNGRLLVVTATVPETFRALANQPNVEILKPMAQSGLFALYNQASVLCHPATDDAFGFVVEEAMHHALPVVISRNTGAWDVVEEGVEGFIVPPRDPDAVAEKLIFLYEHPEARAHMGRAAQRKALNHCTPEVYRQAIRTYYSKIL